MKQIRLLKDEPKAYGGALFTTRKGRAHGRPLDTKNTMHLVLRSSKARGQWSFWRPKNKKKIEEIIGKFSRKYGVKILSMANVGNHLHFQIKLTNRHTFKPFIRAVTAAIAMAVTGASRWQPLHSLCEIGKVRKLRDSGEIRESGEFREGEKSKKLNTADEGEKNEGTPRTKFWDHRPFTRVVIGLRAFLSLRDYIQINRLEGFGLRRPQARFFHAWISLKAAAGGDGG